ncbi:hypothetical protein ACP275_06G172500 [Erythranthe tilingii]
MIKYLLLSFIFFTCLLQEGNGCPIIVSRRVYISIVNSLPPKTAPLTVHCKSKDDDLGNHTLTVNQDFHFDFCLKPFSTLFTCNLAWGNFVSSFQVYNAKWLFLPCDGKHCVYEAKESAIYSSDGEPWGTWICADGKDCYPDS